jgi:hypothetical protein
MPLRARSRASRSIRKASQFCVMPRSSSRSASKPGAITPPSRSSTAGSSAMAACSRACSAGGGCSAASKLSSSAQPAAPASGSVARSTGSVASVARRPLSSRGRIWRSDSRAVMRSTSLTWRSVARSGSASWAMSAATASCRALAIARSRGGCVSQWRSSRLPMPDLQLSSSDSSVGAFSPRRVSVSSRLRWVAGGRSISDEARATFSVATWASAWPWVCSAKLSSAAAAAWATGRSCALKPCSDATFSSAHSLRSPSAVSNCQGGRWVRAARCWVMAVGNGSARSPWGNSNSAGSSRASQPGSSFSLHSVRPSWPLVRPSQARPHTAPPGAVRPWPARVLNTAHSSVSTRSSSSSVSVTVPGVTTRTTLRSTGPLAVATSPTCSAMATASPRRISRAR